MRVFAAIFMLTTGLAAATIDRIAVVVNQHVVKDSDIERDIRIVSFLNRETADFSPASRKVSASRLIDQEYIRREIAAGQFAPPPHSEAEQLLENLKKNQKTAGANLSKTLAARGISEEELRQQLVWQLTVLRFIDQRFRPAAVVTNDDLQTYFDEHRTELRKEHAGKPLKLDDVRAEIQDTIAGERVNQLFYAWLEQRRKAMPPEFHEDVLR